MPARPKKRKARATQKSLCKSHHCAQGTMPPLAASPFAYLKIKKEKRTRPPKPTHLSIFQKKRLRTKKVGTNIKSVRLPPFLPLNSPLHPLIFVRILIVVSRFGLQVTIYQIKQKMLTAGLILPFSAVFRC